MGMIMNWCPNQAALMELLQNYINQKKYTEERYVNYLSTIEELNILKSEGSYLMPEVPIYPCDNKLIVAKTRVSKSGITCFMKSSTIVTYEIK